MPADTFIIEWSQPGQSISAYEKVYADNWLHAMQVLRMLKGADITILEVVEV